MVDLVHLLLQRERIAADQWEQRSEVTAEEAGSCWLPRLALVSL